MSDRQRWSEALALADGKAAKDILALAYEKILPKDGKLYADGHFGRSLVDEARSEAETHLGALASDHFLLTSKPYSQSYMSRDALDQFEKTGFLEDFLIPCFCRTDFASKPLPSMLFPFSALIVHKSRLNLLNWELITNSTTVFEQGRTEKLLKTLFGHIRSLFAKRVTREQASLTADLFSCLHAQWDNPFIAECLVPLFGPGLLKSLVKNDKAVPPHSDPFENIDLMQIFCDQWTLHSRLASSSSSPPRPNSIYSHGDLLEAVMKQPADDFLLRAFIDPLTVRLKGFDEKFLSFVLRPVSFFPSNSITMYEANLRVLDTQFKSHECYSTPERREECDSFISYLSCLLRLFVDLTSNPHTGHYISITLCFWKPHHTSPAASLFSSSPSSARNFFLIDVLKSLCEKLPSFLWRRKLLTLVTQLEINICFFLRSSPSSSSSLYAFIPKQRLHEDDPFYAYLTSTYSALPSERDVIDHLQSNIHFPSIQTSFLDVRDHLIRNFVLYKASITSQIFSDWADGSPSSEVYPISHFSADFSRRMERDQGTRYVCSLSISGGKQFAKPEMSEIADKKKVKGKSDMSPLIFLIRQDGDKIQYFRGCRYWKQGEREKSLLLLVDEQFRTWFVSQPTPPQFTHILNVDPAMTAFSYVLECLEQMMQLDQRDWSWSSSVYPSRLRDLLLGMPPSPESCRYLQEAIPCASQLPAPSHPISFFNAIDDSRPLLKHFKERCAALRSDEKISLELNEDFESRCSLTLVPSPPTAAAPPSSALKFEINFGTKPSAQGQYKTDVKLYEAQKRAVVASFFQHLTLVVGPPGTGKTATTTLLIRILYYNLIRPTFQLGAARHRMLLVTHSNLALDQLITKLFKDENIKSEDHQIPILRLGSQFTNDEAKSCTIAAHEGRLVQRVQFLLKKHSSLVLPPSPSASSEEKKFGHILSHLKPSDAVEPGERLPQRYVNPEAFLAAADLYSRLFSPALFALVQPTPNREDQKQMIHSICKRFLIPDYVTDLVGIQAMDRDLRLILQMCEILSQLPFEREKKLLVENQVLAMTCSQAAMKRRQLADLPAFDIILVEEAGKILETECIPFLSKSPTRVILVGDHLQLSPLVKDTSIRYQSNFDQSLFRRFQRLGVSTVLLDTQGRAKPEIADLYRWRYPVLNDFPTPAHHAVVVPGLAHTVQFIDVFNGRTAEEQNVQEAEMIVATIRHLVFTHAIDPKRISVLTAYKKQKALLTSLLTPSPSSSSRGQFPVPPPRDICTTDEFQGMENDIVLISLVLTGPAPSPHLRDPRRLNVLTSRARHTILFFGRLQTFQDSVEWRRVLQVATENGRRPTSLAVKDRVGNTVLIESPAHFDRIHQQAPPGLAAQELSKKEKPQAEIDLGALSIGTPPAPPASSSALSAVAPKQKPILPIVAEISSSNSNSNASPLKPATFTYKAPAPAPAVAPAPEPVKKPVASSSSAPAPQTASAPIKKSASSAPSWGFQDLDDEALKPIQFPQSQARPVPAQAIQKPQQQQQPSASAPAVPKAVAQKEDDEEDSWANNAFSSIRR